MLRARNTVSPYRSRTAILEMSLLFYCYCLFHWFCYLGSRFPRSNYLEYYYPGSLYLKSRYPGSRYPESRYLGTRYLDYCYLKFRYPETLNQESQNLSKNMRSNCTYCHTFVRDSSYNERRFIFPMNS